MPYLVLKGDLRFRLQKRLVTVGTSDQHDVLIRTKSEGLSFSLVDQGRGYELVPAGIKIKLNGSTLYRTTALSDCDRIEWDGGSAIYLASELPMENTSRNEATALRSLDVLQNLATTIQNSGSFSAALHQALEALVQIAGAETGYLITETSDDSSGWELVASYRAEGTQTRSELLSNTILREALAKRDVVYVENTIGHPLSEAASIIQSRIFSAACFPLYVGERTFGAVFLATRSPGKSIRREALGELRLLATQAMLMLTSQAQAANARRETQRIRALVKEWPSELLYDREASALMRELDRKIDKLAPTPLSLLILGETGTGKEVVATEIHRRSPRAQGPMISVNCAAIPENLLEATLFGYEKGAFTGAIKNTRGKFQLAHGGTLFLDEIGDLPSELQSKLLRVLQERKVEPLGSEKPVSIDVRVLAATHQDLDRLVREGRFRQDLLFRLNGASLKLPPLRDRAEDVELLTKFFLNRSGSRATLSAGALSALKRHSWPGNVRELEQVITRASFLTENENISEADLELTPPSSGAESGFFSPISALLNLEEAQQSFTREFVAGALDRNQGNRVRTAEQLGISERTLYRIISRADEIGRNP